MNTATKNRIIRSEAMDALRAKEHDARRRLARHVLAFVRAPKRTGLRGWVFYATDSHLATYQHFEDDRDPRTCMFTVFMVGNPRVQVHDSRDIVQEFCDHNSDVLDEQDCHAGVVLSEVKAFQVLYLEDKEEPRANAVEFLFIDDEEDLYWCAYDGSYAGQKVAKGDQSVIIRGCYDQDVRRSVQEVLRRYCRQARPNTSSLKAAVRAIRKATRLPHVGYVPIR